MRGQRNESSAARNHDEPVTLLGAAEILRREAEKDTSRSQNDRAELRIAAPVCEAVAQRV